MGRSARYSVREALPGRTTFGGVMTRTSRLSTSFLALATLGALGGCVIPSQQATVAPKRFVETPTITAQASAKYGAEAGRAYQELADFVLDQDDRADLLEPGRTQFSTADLTTGIIDHMTPSAAATWERYVTAALAGDAEAQEAVRALRFYKLHAPGLTLPPKGSPVESQAVTGARVDVAKAVGTVVPLKITFEHETRINLMNGKTRYPGTISNTLEFVVLPAALVVATPAKPANTTTPTDPTNPATQDSATPGGTPASTPAATGTPLVPSSAYTRDPAARWLINQFEGDVEVAFDKAPATPSGTSRASTGGQSPTADGSAGPTG